MARREKDYTPVAADEPVIEPDIDAFSILWAKHSKSIILGAVAVVAIAAIVLAWVMISHTNRVAAEGAFAAARTLDDYRAVIAKYPRSIVAGNASLLLASSLRTVGKIDEANAALRDFISAMPEHPLVGLASLALAENDAKAGKFPEAAKALQATADAYPKSFAAPVALMIKGDLELALGERNDSLKTFQSLSRLYERTAASDSARPAYEALQSLARRASKQPPKDEAAEKPKN